VTAHGDDLGRALRRCGLCRSLTDARLDALAGAAQEVTAERGTELIREADAADAMFVVLDGAVQVYTSNAEGKEIVLARLESGDHFGEQALLPGSTGRRNASVRAVERVRAARIPKATFQAALAEDDVLRERVVQLGVDQVRARVQQLSPLASAIELDKLGLSRRELGAGEVLFHQGDAADALYFVSVGRLAVWREHEGERMFVRYVDRGGCVGELALVQHSRRSATVVADEPSQLLAVPRATFEPLYRGSTAIREHFATLQSVYELPRRGIVTQHAGSLDGHDCITTLYHLRDGGVFVAYRLIGSNVYTLERLGAGSSEVVKWSDGGRSRELRRGPDGVIVGVTAVGDWPDAHALHLLVLDGGRISPADLQQFLRTGTVALGTSAEAEDIVCHCVHVSSDALRAAIEQGAATLSRLRQLTGCGAVCGSCVPIVAEMLGAEEWVLADVVTEREEAPGIRSFELAPRRASYPAAQPGQHVLVEGLVGNLRVRRPYTVSSAVEDDGRLRITVKRERDGTFSPWLFDQRPKDQPLRITRPRGDYVIELSRGEVVCLVAGIGVTPAVAAARTTTASAHAPRLFIHYSGRSREQMACVQELEDLARGNVELVVRETAREGRLAQAEVQQLVGRFPRADWYLCGPPAYLDQMRRFLVAAGVAAANIHVEAFTPVGSAPAATAEERESRRRYLLVPAAPGEPRSVVRALRRVGAAVTSLANSPLTDWRLGPLQLNPLRWLETRLARAAGVDPAVPFEHLAMVSALSWGPFEYQLRAFERMAAHAPETTDGDTFAYWMPVVELPRFPAECAVHTGWTRTGAGRVVPVYVTRNRTALDHLLRRGEETERSAVPYHFVQQVTGRTDVRSCPGRMSGGLIAGQFHDNATWSEDRALATETFGFPVIDDFGSGMAATLTEVCAAIDEAIAHEPDAIVDLDALLCRLAHATIVRALFGGVDLAEIEALGRELSEPVGRLLGYVGEFVMGRQSIPRDYTEMQRAARTTSRAIVDFLVNLDRRGKLSDAQRAKPVVRTVLELGGGSRPNYERLHALFVPLIIAGHETAGHTLAWAFYEMARNDGTERAVLSEIQRFRAAHGARPFTTVEYDERPMAWALLAEVLRRHPPVQSVARSARRDGVVAPDPETGTGGFRYPSGAVIILSIVGVHLDPKRWPDPLLFRPDRWLTGVREDMSPTEKGRTVRATIRAREQALDWISFADGHSRCPGQHFAAHEFLVVLDALLSRYRFELVDPKRQVANSAMMIVGPASGTLAVRIRPRR
jgi:ferredoxin-NADP reductase/CRP-like cAMP-binding protein/cytochrome P450